MYVFPENLYTDVRIEEISYTRIGYIKKELTEEKIRKNTGAFIRVYDGERWYYSSTTDIEGIQGKIDDLSIMATENYRIKDIPVVKAFEVNRDEKILFSEKDISKIPVEEKRKLLRDYLDLLDHEEIVHHTSYYTDTKTVKKFYSSKGANLSFDKQTCGIGLSLELSFNDEKDEAGISRSGIYFDDLKDIGEFFEEEINKSIEFIKKAKPVTPGKYTVILSPEATGVFTHESFGHKSESDFMAGDETMKKEWALGKTIGKKLLNISDDNTVSGNGYTPYDDEGTKGKKTKIISEGKLTGRLHSAFTASEMDEPLTGNARATGFEFEPIVRMTTTFIEKGDTPLKEIIESTPEGIYVETIKHGSGMSTFTMAPARAYKIKDGKIAHPVKVSVVTGNVFKTLEEVDAVSKEYEILSFVGGGCGKMEQWPLKVGFGGPYIRVNNLNVQ